MNSIPIITCPLDCIAAFSEVLEYNHPLIDQVLRQNAVYNPVILDIGANVGAFTLWCQDRFRTATIYCYEPNSDIFPILSSNVQQDRNIILCHNLAAGDQDAKCLYADRNRLCSSMGGNGVGDCIQQCNVIEPKHLPKANIIKMDCEGSEGYICEHLTHIPEYLVLEYHSEELMHRCLNALRGKMVLAEHKIQHEGLGIMKFFRI